MRSAADLLAARKRPARPAPHAKAAAVNEIIEFLKSEPKQLGYGYWLRKVGKASYGDVMAILKRAKDLPAKYNRGGYVTNQLKAGALSRPRGASGDL